MIEAYKTALEALDKGDVLFAQKFNEAELLYPQSDWPKIFFDGILCLLVTEHIMTQF